MAPYQASRENTITEPEAIDLHARRAAAEYSVVRLLASSPRWLGDTARAEGLTADDFEEADLRIIALGLLYDSPTIELGARFRVIKQLLIDAGHWLAEEVDGNRGSHWSDDKLAGLGIGVKADSGIVRTAIAGLRGIQAALRAADRKAVAA